MGSMRGKRPYRRLSTDELYARIEHPLFSDAQKKEFREEIVWRLLHWTDAKMGRVTK